MKKDMIFKKKPSLEILRSLLSNFEISPENRVICSLKKWKMLYFYLSFFLFYLP